MCLALVMSNILAS